MDARRHGCCVWVGLIALSVCVRPDAARAGQIRLWPTAVVEHDAVLLADVAELRGFDAATTETLVRRVVVDAPRPGGEILLTADDLRTALAESGANLAEVSIFGASRCKVARPRTAHEEVRPAPKLDRVAEKPPLLRAKSARAARRPRRDPMADSRTQTSADDTLERALRDFITARAGLSSGRLEIRFSPACARDLSLPAESHRFEIHPRDSAKFGLLSFEVDVADASGAARTVPVVAEVALLREVVVARRPINRGETIESRALKLEERRFTDEAALGLTDLAASVGMRSRGFLRAGDMLTPREIEDKPVVNRGQPVTIWMRSGGLVIRATGKAQQAGRLGDRVEVLRDGTHRKQDLLEAVVTGPGTVSVEPEAQVALGRD